MFPAPSSTIWRPRCGRRTGRRGRTSREGGRRFKLVSDYEPAGDQPTAIAELVAGVKAREHDQVLLGVTGSGKTFTMAKVIERDPAPGPDPGPQQDPGRPALQRVQELLPGQRGRVLRLLLRLLPARGLRRRAPTPTSRRTRRINEQIDRMRHSATRAILERDDVIVVASVSCIYGIGSVETYTAMTFTLERRRQGRREEADGRPGGPAVQAQRPGLRARHLPPARRHHRDLPGPLRGPRLARSACSATRSRRSPSSTR